MFCMGTNQQQGGKVPNVCIGPVMLDVRVAFLQWDSYNSKLKCDLGGGGGVAKQTGRKGLSYKEDFHKNPKGFRELYVHYLQ